MIQNCQKSHQRHPKAPVGFARIILFVFLYLECLLPQVASDFEICNPGKSEAVFQFRVEDCPYGVLFEHPVTAYCMNSTSPPESFFTDLCDENNYSFNIADVPFKIQLAFGQDDEPIDADSSCAGDAPGKCNVTEVINATPTTLTEPDATDTCDIELFESILTPDEESRRQDARVFNQTERMFKFIVGLLKDHNPDGPNFRLVKLLRQSFKLLKTYCDIDYVTPKFGEDVLNAFLFLLRDSDLSNFKDISVEDYEIVMKTLSQCERMPRDPFRLIGKKCKTCSTAHSIEKDGQSVKYGESVFSFTWGRFDLPVDATWGILSFVHGLCYGTFRLNLNYHHVFQRVSEKLFTPEIQYRWNRPPLLYFEDIWDNMFSTPVKATMKNLDVCIFAAYHNTPFIHRLERPIDVQAPLAGPDAPTTPAAPEGTRKKRSAPTVSLDVQGLTGAGWCFQSREDLLATTKAYIDLYCPGVKNPIEELEEIFKPSTIETGSRGSNPAQ